MVTDGGFTSRQNILEMEAKAVDFIGSLGEGQAQSAGQMERRGVAEQFYPDAFGYDAAQDSYQCPAGQTLRHTGQEQRPGVVQPSISGGGARLRGLPVQVAVLPSERR